MKIIRNIMLCFLLFSLNSCESWLDVNKSPDAPATVDYKEVLPAGISSIAYVMGGKYQVLGALWSQHWTQSPGASQYAGIDSYDINSSSFDDGQYGELYSGGLKALEYVKTESLKEEEWNYYLIANVMQAYIFQVLADLYDKVPFSEALKGDGDNLNAHFEKGSDIYDSLIVRLDDALARNFDYEDLKDPGDKDILFQGDIDRWKEFANTLKLKIYIRECEVPAKKAIAEAGIRKLFTDKVNFLSTDVMLNVFLNESGRYNPLYGTEVVAFSGNPNLIVSNTLYSYLSKFEDFDRIDGLFNTPDEGGGHKSLLQGDYNNSEIEAGTNSSSYSKPILRASDPVYLMSFSEGCFLQAEAIIRYNVKSYSEANKIYTKGVEAAYLRLFNPGRSYDQINEQTVTGYPAEYNFTTEGSSLETFIEKIITQKWISLAGIQSLETFFEHNRTHYPKESAIIPEDTEDKRYVPGEFTLSVNNVTSGKFPKRLIFPESEIAGNPNTPERKPVWEKIWWDTKE